MNRSPPCNQQIFLLIYQLISRIHAPATSSGSLGYWAYTNLSLQIKMKQATNDLTIIPGVGKNIANDLIGIGIREVHDLVDKNPEDLYLQLCDQKGTKVDRCVLYVFRCAIYYATARPHDPELLKWWNWKDR